MNTQRLLDLCRANERSHDFDLSTWVSDCGTYGCLVGNHVVNCGEPELEKLFERMIVAIQQVAGFYGITLNEGKFLFSEKHIRRRRFGLDVGCYGDYRDALDKDAALNRVRKFIYYKLHKQELMYEEDGRIKESARHSEGDHNVIDHVVKSLQPA